MKKIIVVLAIGLLVGMLLNSCKSNQKCPAYSKVSKIEKSKV